MSDPLRNRVSNAFVALPSLIRLCAVAGLLGVAASGAFAQSPKIFVASYGDDNNPGNSVSPMRTFQSAYNAVATGGQIVVLDTAGYGPVSIAKSLVITVPPGVNGFITASGSYNGVTITTGANDVVSLRGLIIEGPGRSVGGISGVVFNAAGTLRMENCVVRNFATGINVASGYSTNVTVRGCTVQDAYNGIYVSPNAASSTSSTNVTATTVENASNAGITVNTPLGSASSLASIDRCAISHCAYALNAVGSGASVIDASECVLGYNINTVRIQGTGSAVNSLGGNKVTNSGFDTVFTSTLQTY